MNLKDYEDFGNKVFGMLDLLKHEEKITKDSHEYIQSHIKMLFNYTKEIQEKSDAWDLEVSKCCMDCKKEKSYDCPLDDELKYSDDYEMETFWCSSWSPK